MCKHELKLNVGQFIICAECGKYLDKEKKKSGVWRVIDDVKKTVGDSGT